LHENGTTTKSFCDHRGNFYIEAPNLRRVCWISLDEWRAAFGVSAPLQYRIARILRSAIAAGNCNDPENAENTGEQGQP
jgi:hypothetical protein